MSVAAESVGAWRAYRMRVATKGADAGRAYRMRRLWLVPASAVVLLGTLGPASCSSDGSADVPSLKRTLAAAKRQLDETPGVRFVLSTNALPQGIAGLLEADGVGTHAPAFKGDITVSQSGVSIPAKVVAVNSEVYAKISFSPVYTRIDPAHYGAPDPASLMDEETGISSLLTAAEDVTDKGQRRDGSDVLQSISATIPGPAVVAIFPSAATVPFEATFDVTDEEQLRRAEIRGPFYRGKPPVTYTLELTSYGERVEISPP